MTKGVLYNIGAVALNEKFLLGRFTKLNLIILLLLASLSLVGCQSPVTYAPGRTTADLPHQKSTIVFSGVTEGSMTGDKSIPNSSQDQLRINDVVRDELVSYLNKQSISVVSDREKCSDCISIKTLVYFLPWNPITGGHVNVFIDSYDLQDRKIFTAGHLHLPCDLRGFEPRSADLASMARLFEVD